MKKGFKLAVKLSLTAFALFTLFFALIIYTQETGPFSNSEWPYTCDKTENVAVNYFKKEKNVDIVITNTGFSSELLGSDVYIEGHIKNNKQKKIKATVDSIDNYKIKEAIVFN
ncbi:hypothetical protein [Paenibacillus alvei]|nr:hypothetical protein [Paenibacillus alvei]